MSNQLAAEKAAKALAKQLNIPSWQGGVSVWWKDGDLLLQVLVEPSWVAASRVSIPSEYEGFKVEQGLPLRGTAHKEFKMTNYA